jgi:hypothetical protein
MNITLTDVAPYRVERDGQHWIVYDPAVHQLAKVWNEALAYAMARNFKRYN